MSIGWSAGMPVPVTLYDVPPPCRYALADGPGATFACMRLAGRVTPVFESIRTVEAGVLLPGTLPPTPAAIPAVLLASGDRSWYAVTIAHADAYPDARSVLVTIASSVR